MKQLVAETRKQLATRYSLLATRPAQRRGVLLLVVLSLLVIFALIAVSFVIIAGQQERAAKQAAKMEQTGKDPLEYLDGGVYQLLRDTNNPRSVVRGHSLLRDMYGSDGFTGEISWMPRSGKLAGPMAHPWVPDMTGGQFYDLFVYYLGSSSSNSDTPKNLSGFHFDLSTIDGFYNGSLLTITSGPAAGLSARVVDYQYNSSITDPYLQARFRVMVIANDRGQSLLPGTVLASDNLVDPTDPRSDPKNPLSTSGSGYDPSINASFIVNGRPFNGTGAGLETTVSVDKPKLSLSGFHPGQDGAWGVLNFDDDGINGIDNPNEAGLGDDIAIPWVALQPNRVFPPSENFRSKNYLAGGLDESYDAVDFQNMALAYLPVTAREPDILTDTNPLLIPSFHRPALVNYWYHWMDQAKDAQFETGWEAHTSEDRWYAIHRPYGDDWQPGTGDDSAATLDQLSRIIAIKRKISLRPLREDHPKFTGGNLGTTRNVLGDIVNSGGAISNYQERIGPWDIDNDGDGVRESVWVDLGYPVVRQRDGRLYKPLFAFLCVDLDGRLNVNAHGSLVDLNASMSLPISQVNPQTLAGGGSSDMTLPRGQGYGPPEITLRHVITNTTDYANLVAERMAEDNRPGGLTGVVDRHATIEFSEVPDRSDGLNGTTMERMAYGSAPNLHGAYGIGLDARGTPVIEAHPADVLLRTDTPYEMDLSRTGARGHLSKTWGNDADWGTTDDEGPADKPFSVYELERILRPFDVDVSLLETRLRNQLDNTLTSNPQLARLLTTDSWDLPVPSVATTRDLRADGLDFPSDYRTVLDILDYRLRVGGVQAVSPDTFTDDNGNGIYDFGENYTDNNGNGKYDFSRAFEVRRLLSPELAMGLRMDVNRPFGNGRDDTPTNGVVDEPGENTFAAPDRLWRTLSDQSTDPFGIQTIDFKPLDANSDGTINGADYLLQRQLYARHLYVLMMALTDQNYVEPVHPSLGLNPTVPANRARLDKLRARRIAQWAINVVDFRDADAIMTPFEYDAEPFDGWDVDGNLSTTADWEGGAPRNGSDDIGGVVWGCERPELVMTETLAWHDRRTEDLGTPGGKYDDGTGPGSGPDPNFDQRLRPRGAVFIELYNPSPSSEIRPAEFYDVTLPPANQGVILDQLSSSGNSPVWRMIVVQGASHIEDRNPDDLAPIVGNSFTPKHIERSVYFADPTPAGITNHGLPYHTSMAVAPLLPGRYAVVGSSGVLFGGDHVSFAGRRTNAVEGGSLNLGTTRRISLSPSGSAANHQVEVFDNGTAEPATPDIQPAIAIAIDQPRSLSISDPPTINGYRDLGPVGEVWTPGPPDNEGMYVPPIDEPLDTARAAAPEWSPLMLNGTKERFRTIHLQRLANPLEDWHATRNPYLTVDTLSVDLTAFNGVTNDADPNAVAGFVNFASLQRGDQDQNVTSKRNLWSHERPNQAPTANSPAEGVGTGPHRFAFELRHSLGYLNTKLGPAYTAATSPPHPFDAPPYRFYAGSPVAMAPTPDTFPWLTWNNRPFVSQYELMQVPASSSSRLFYEFSLDTNDDPYDATANDYNNFRAPYRHLLNFFQTARVPDDGSTETAAHFYRLFDYTHVPSRFVGTETVLNPAAFGDITTLQTDRFRPPFNKMPTYREPGRVNINTITHESVWDGVLKGHPGPTADQVSQSRRGYDDGVAGDLLINDDSPTFFANPFRGSGAGELVPIEDLMRPDVECTILRSTQVGDTNGTTKNDPTDPPRFARTSGNSHDDPTRNPYFKYQTINRLGNLVTTRSNVYAVWVTVGFFEVSPAPAPGVLPHIPNQAMRDLVYPDGYQLGQELGSDTGEIRRHRGFYIIDRSVPVAFEPGENHDVDRAVLLRRFIE